METSARDRAANLAKTNTAAALEAARGIAGAFMRAQALAWVARFAEGDAQASSIAREAEQALAAADDPWEGAAGTAWPLAALAERAQLREATALLGRAVAAAERVPHPLRRVDALFLIVQAGWSLPPAGLDAAVRRLAGAAGAAQGEKADAVLRDLVLMLARAGRDTSAAFMALPEGKARRQAERRLDERAFRRPRPFFF